MKGLIAGIMMLCVGAMVAGCDINRVAEDSMTVTRIERSNYPELGSTFYVVTSRTGAVQYYFSDKPFAIGDKLVLTKDSPGGTCEKDLQE